MIDALNEARTYVDAKLHSDTDKAIALALIWFSREPTSSGATRGRAQPRQSIAGKLLRLPSSRS
jgi:hypothetical protein